MRCAEIDSTSTIVKVGCTVTSDDVFKRSMPKWRLSERR